MQVQADNNKGKLLLEVQEEIFEYQRTHEQELQLETPPKNSATSPSYTWESHRTRGEGGGWERERYERSESVGGGIADVCCCLRLTALHTYS